MEHLAVHTQKDVFPNLPDNKEKTSFVHRKTGKIVVFNKNGDIALVGNVVNDFYLLPGGGVEEAESVEEGMVRECLEEIGCHVELKENMGTIEDFRNRDKKHYTNYCYTAELVGEPGEVFLTENEKKNGLHMKWVPLDEAINILEKEADQLKKGEVTFYNTGFNILRDFRFLKEAKLKRDR